MDTGFHTKGAKDSIKEKDKVNQEMVSRKGAKGAKDSIKEKDKVNQEMVSRKGREEFN